MSEPKRTPKPCNTCKKKTGRSPEFPPVLWQGQKDLVSAAASVGSRQSATGARSPHDTHCAGAQPCLVAESLCALTKNREASTMLASLFLAGAEGLSLAGRLGRFAAERHWRSLTPRHAVLEWMWEQTTRSGRGPVSPGSCRKPERGRCCELFLEKDCVSTTTSSFERKAPPPGGWPS